MDLAALADEIGAAAGPRRRLCAIAGAPGSGKSTLAEALAAELNRRNPGLASVMPMDGFHYDNAVLDALGLRSRKGAPETFDVDGFAHALARIKTADRPVAVPVFDRGLDLARAGGRIIGPEVPVILVEGNYLLLDAPDWIDLAPLFDRTLFVEAPEPELERRLVQRWLDHGHNPETARARALGNDIPNARLVVTRSRPADIRWRGD
jgi:pantothenate kinase